MWVQLPSKAGYSLWKKLIKERSLLINSSNEYFNLICVLCFKGTSLLTKCFISDLVIVPGSPLLLKLVFELSQASGRVIQKVILTR